MENRVLQSKLHSLCREQLYQSMIEEVKSSEISQTVVGKFYRALALLFTNKPEDALGILTPLNVDPVFNLGSLLAAIHIYKHLSVSNNLEDGGDAVAQLETALRNERKKANDKSLYYASLFLHFCDRQDKAREYADRMLSINPGPGNVDGLILKGWIEIFSSPDRSKKKGKPLDCFNSAIAIENLSVEAHQGKIRCLVAAGNISEAIPTVNHVISTFLNNPDFPVEKLRVHLAAKDWDAVSEQIKRIHGAIPAGGSPLVIKTLEIQILATVCHDGSFVDATPLLKKLFNALEKYESSNGELFLRSARLFSRVCGRHLPILNECQNFVERAARLDEKNPNYLMELARQQALHGRFKEALSTLKTVGQQGDASLEATLLKIHCLVDDEQYDAAQQQFAILEELHEDLSTYPQFLFVKAMLLRQKNSLQEALQLLKHAYQLQVKDAAWLPYGVEHLIQFDPDFLLTIAEEIFQHHSPQESQQTLSDLKDILESVVDACPGLLPALYRLANVSFMAGDYRAASDALHHIIDHVDPTYFEAYLLMAQIGLDQNNLAQAAQYLEMGLSYNFQVRDHPRYHLLLARVQRQKKEYEAALSSLRSAMILGGMRPSSAGTKRSKFQFNLAEKAATYLELFHVFAASGQKEEAGQVIQEAFHELKNTPQEGSILLAQVDYMLEEDDIDGALQKLKSLPNTHPQSLKAREKMADIYLHRLQDEALYLQCYRDIAQQQPNLRNLTLLGDAHLALHQVDTAVSAYEEALKLEPRNSRLASKIGAALVLTHQYTKALNYYKDALRDTSAHPSLRGEYASLLIRLGQRDKAEKIIIEALAPGQQVESGKVSETLLHQVQLLMLLAKVHDKNGDQEASINALRRAQGMMNTLLKRADPPEHVAEQKKMASVIAVQMANHAHAERDTEASIRLYREALIHTPDDIRCMSQLAKVYLQAGDVEHCQYMCKSLLKLDRENEQAMMMVAQIALRKNDLETATHHFRQALERQQCNYEMLGQFIDVCRRRGNIADALGPLQAAGASSTHGQNEPGLSYCQGLYDFYSGQHNAALLALNRARGHATWGQYAIRVMLDICLNGDSEMLENVGDLDAQYEVEDTELMALHTASKLLLELQPVEDDALHTHILYPNLYLLATRQKSNVERALVDLTTFSSKHQQQDNPGIIFGLATAHLLLKQTQKARTQLKRLIKWPWTLEEGEYLERCWLLLSDIYIQAGQNKMDVANELVGRVLTYNRSSAKAFEYLGYILEKEQSYREAATHFASAWKMTNQNNALVGYKLALAYLKGKQYTDAIDVSQTVLTKYPDHPRIRKDVLDKALLSLRT